MDPLKYPRFQTSFDGRVGFRSQYVQVEVTVSQMAPVDLDWVRGEYAGYRLDCTAPWHFGWGVHVGGWAHQFRARSVARV